MCTSLIISLIFDISDMAGCSDQQTSEVAAIKAAFPNRCRVIKDSGRFSHIVTVQPENLDATIKFQLPGEFSNNKSILHVFFKIM